MQIEIEDYDSNSRSPGILSKNKLFRNNSLTVTRSSSMEIVTEVEKRTSGRSDNKDNQQYDYANLTIFNSPILSVKVLLYCLLDFLASAFWFIMNWIIPITTIAAAGLSFFYMPGPHEEVSATSFNDHLFSVPISRDRLCHIRILLDQSRCIKLSWLRLRATHLYSLFGTPHCESCFSGK